MGNFILPIVTGIISSVIVYYFTRYFSTVREIRFFGFSPIAGTYKGTYENQAFPDDTLIINQMGGAITGNVLNKEKIKTHKIYGKITHSRSITYQFHSINDKISDYGVALMQFNKDCSQAKGIVTFIDEDEAPVSVKAQIDFIG